MAGGLGDILAKVGANIEPYLNAMDQVVNKTAETVDKAESRFASFETVGMALAKVGAGLTATVTLPMLGLGEASLSAAGKMEQTVIGFTTLLKSGEAASAMLRDLRDFALKTPFEFAELTGAAQKLMAMGFAAKDLIPTMRTIGDATAALGKGAETFDRIGLALGQMSNSAKLSAADMKQLTEAGIKGWQYLSDATGIAMKDIQEKAKDVLTGAEAAQIVMQGMARDFAGGMEAQSRSLIGMWSNTKDAINFALADIGKSLLPTAKLILDNFILPSVEGLKSLAAWFGALPQPIQTGALAIAGMAAAAGPLLLAVGGIGIALPAVAAGFAAISEILIAVGIRMVAFATVTVPAAVTAVGTFATVTLPAAIAALGMFARTMLVDAAASVATFATVSLPAAMAALVSFTTTTIPGAISALVTFAGTAITGAITALGTLSATSIPAAISAFSSLATGGIASAVAGLTSMATSALPVLIGALSVAGVAVLAVGAAFVGWKLGEWLYANIPLVAQFGDTLAGWVRSIPVLGGIIDKLTGIKAAQDALQQADSDFARATENLAKHLASKGVVIERGTMTMDAYNKALQAAAKGLGDGSIAANLAKVAVTNHAQAQKKANDELKLAQKVLAETNKLYKQGAASQADVTAALSKVREASAKAHPELKQTGITVADYNKSLKDNEYHALKFNGAMLEHVVRLQKLKQGLSDATGEEILWNLQVATGNGLMNELAHSLDGAGNSITSLIPDLRTANEVMRQVAVTIDGARLEVSDFEAAVKRQGLQSADSLKTTAEQAKRDYETISGSANATQGVVDAAWAKMMEAEIAYRRALGENVTGLEQELAKYDNAHKNHSTRVKSTWQEISDGINSAVAGFSRNLSDTLTDLFTGEFSIARLGDAFKQLGLDIANVFLKQATDAIAAFIAGALTDLISMKGLGGVADALKSIGSAIGGIFGAGKAGLDLAIDTSIATAPAIAGAATSAGGAAASAAGTAASTAGQVAGMGVSAVAGIVTGAISAVTGVIGNFQNARQETTLNAIEHNTRYSMMYLGERGDGGIIGVLFKIQELVWYGPLVTAVQQLRDSAFFQYALPNLDAIQNSTFYMLQKVDEIRGLMAGGAGGGGHTFHMHFHGPVSDEAYAQELFRKFTREVQNAIPIR